MLCCRCCYFICVVCFALLVSLELFLLCRGTAGAGYGPRLDGRGARRHGAATTRALNPLRVNWDPVPKCLKDWGCFHSIASPTHAPTAYPSLEQMCVLLICGGRMCFSWLWPRRHFQANEKLKPVETQDTITLVSAPPPLPQPPPPPPPRIVHHCPCPHAGAAGATGAGAAQQQQQQQQQWRQQRQQQEQEQEQEHAAAGCWPTRAAARHPPRPTCAVAGGCDLHSWAFAEI